MSESVTSSIQVLNLDDDQQSMKSDTRPGSIMASTEEGGQTPRRNSLNINNTETLESAQSAKCIKKRVDEIESRVETLEKKATFQSQVNYAFLEAGYTVPIGNVWQNETREWRVEVQKVGDSLNFRMIVDGVEANTCLRGTFNLTITSSGKLIAELKNQLLVIDSTSKTYEHVLSWCDFVNARNEYLHKESDGVFLADFDVKIRLQSAHLFGIHEDPRQLLASIDNLKGIIAAQQAQIDSLKRKDVINLEFHPSKAGFENSFRSEPVEWEGLQLRLRAQYAASKWAIYLEIHCADNKPCAANFTASYTASYKWTGYGREELKSESSHFKRVANDFVLLIVPSSYLPNSDSRLGYKLKMKIHSVHST